MGGSESCDSYKSEADNYKKSWLEVKDKLDATTKTLDTTSKANQECQSKLGKVDGNQVKALQNEISDYKSQIASLQNDITNYKKQVADLSKPENTQATQKLLDMQDKYKKLKNEYQELADNPCPELKKENQSYQERNSQLQLQLTNCQKGAGWNDDAYKAMKKQIDLAEARIKELEASNEQLRNDKTASVKSLQDMTDQNNEMITDNAKYKDIIDNSNTQLKTLFGTYGQDLWNINNAYQDIQTICRSIASELNTFTAGVIADSSKLESLKKTMITNINTVIHDKIIEGAVWSGVNNIKIKEAAKTLYTTFSGDNLKALLTEIGSIVSTLDKQMIEIKNYLINFDLTKVTTTTTDDTKKDKYTILDYEVSDNQRECVMVACLLLIVVACFVAWYVYFRDGSKNNFFSFDDEEEYVNKF